MGDAAAAALSRTSTLSSLRFDNSFVRELPPDPLEHNSVRQVRGACFTRVVPTPVRAPKLLAYSDEVAALLGLSRAACESEQFAQVFAGNGVLEGMEPYAACYGGHQFGNWAGQLGDGRAISLGEVLNARGERWELQLKGAGRTPYSRTADGRAVLRSSLREFVCSEAMFHLGVPTTRALSLVTTGEEVVRDILYDGNPRAEPGAVVCRVAPSFLRFGHFEIFAARDEHAVLEKLGAYALKMLYPHLGAPSPRAYASMLRELCERTATMIVHWMRVGFVHGVMNTDNMSMLGLTIDYGPYGFLGPYDPTWTPNTTDAAGRRYRYENQPQIALWNLVRLAHALHPLVRDADLLEEALQTYADTLEAGLRTMLASKLGLRSFHVEPHMHGDAVLPPDHELVNELLAMLRMVETDVTLFYRHLADVSVDRATTQSDAARFDALRPAYYAPEQLTDEQRRAIAAWLSRYIERVRADGTRDDDRRARMNAVNPKFIFHNYLAQTAIDHAERGDTSVLHELFDVLRRPYDEQPSRAEFARKWPDWARNRPGCSMLSCSS